MHDDFFYQVKGLHLRHDTDFLNYGPDFRRPAVTATLLWIRISEIKIFVSAFITTSYHYEPEIN